MDSNCQARELAQTNCDAWSSGVRYGSVPTCTFDIAMRDCDKILLPNYNPVKKQGGKFCNVKIQVRLI